MLITDFIFVNICFFTLLYIIYWILKIQLGDPEKSKPRVKHPPTPMRKTEPKTKPETNPKWKPERKVYRTRLRVKKEKEELHKDIQEQHPSEKTLGNERKNNVGDFTISSQTKTATTVKQNTTSLNEPKRCK